MRNCFCDGSSDDGEPSGYNSEHIHAREFLRPVERHRVYVSDDLVPNYNGEYPRSGVHFGVSFVACVMAGRCIRVHECSVAPDDGFGSGPNY